MTRVKLTEAAAQICRDNYARPCDKCPIRSACKSDKNGGQDGLDAWRTRVNEAASAKTAEVVA